MAGTRTPTPPRTGGQTRLSCPATLTRLPAVTSMLLLLLLSGPVTAQTGFDQDFVHSFLQRPEKLQSSARLTEQSSSWLQQTGYQVT